MRTFNNVFVFGSNLAGRHGKGAALEAFQNWGAKMNVGIGRAGNSYAIPTKGFKMEVLPLDEIEFSIGLFLDHATENPHDFFITTPIGTGLAGYSLEEIKSIFQDNFDIPKNVVFTKDWYNSQTFRA